MRLRVLALLLLAAAAPGDWHEDAPGAVHRVIQADLPPPHATPSTANSPDIARRPPGMLPQVPHGFTVSLWAQGLDMPRVLRRAPDGSVFLAESGAGRVLRFAADGSRASFATGLDRPFGIAFWPPAAPRFVYVAETGRVLRYPWTPGQAAPNGAAQVVAADLPTGGHWTRDLAAAPDGSRLFLSVGSESNAGADLGPPPATGFAAWEAAHGVGAAWGEESGRAVVEWMAPEGGALHPYAQGLRNCSGLAVQPGTARMWCVTNERDGLGDDLPPDYATALIPGGFYGWPWFYLGAHADPRFNGARPDLAGQVIAPDVLLAAHSAPLGITFYDGTAFPPAWRGAYVALHGSWNRRLRTGYKVVKLGFDGDRPDGTYQDFLTGFVLSDDAVWGRPVGVAVAADGALLVSEDAHGTIWRIMPQRP